MFQIEYQAYFKCKDLWISSLDINTPDNLNQKEIYTDLVINQFNIQQFQLRVQ